LFIVQGAGGQHAEGAVQRVGDAAGRLDVAGHHRGRRARVEHAAFRHDDVQRLQAAGVERDGVVDQRAEDVEHRRGGDGTRGVEVAVELRAGAGEVDHRAAGRGIHAHRHLHLRAVVQRQRERAVLQLRDGAAHAFLGVVLHVAHVGGHGGVAVLGHQRLQFAHALLVGGDLRAQVGQVLLRVARGVRAGLQPREQLGLAERALPHQRQVVEQHALFADVARERRHRAGRDAADVGMVAAAADIERRARMAVEEHRRDDGDIGQVRAAVVRVVEHEGVAGAGLGMALDDAADRVAHRAQVHRHVRRIGDQRAVGIEQRARKIEPLLDVDRVRGVLQHQPHLLGDGHEAVVEDFEHHRVDGGADGFALRARLHAGEQQVAAGGAVGAPAGFDQGGGVGFGDERRAVDHGVGGEVLAAVQGGVAPAGGLIVGVAIHLDAAGCRSGFSRDGLVAGHGSRLKPLLQGGQPARCRARSRQNPASNNCRAPLRSLTSQNCRPSGLTSTTSPVCRPATTRRPSALPGNPASPASACSGTASRSSCASRSRCTIGASSGLAASPAER
jgi:hypothetical protein